MRKNLKGFGRGQNRYSVYDNEGIKSQNCYVRANSHDAADYKVKQRFGEYAKAGKELSTKDWEWMTEDQEFIVQPSKFKRLIASTILLIVMLSLFVSLFNFIVN